MFRRPTFAVLLAATLALTTLAFAQPRTVGYPDLGMVPGTAGGTVTLALGDSPPRFFYYGEISNVSQTLTQQMFDSLVEFDLENYELVPGLAASWDVSEDGTIYTFSLRDGVTWHDGEPFTADDVVFTYEQIITNPEARAGDAANFQFTVDGEARPVTFEAVDPLTVRMTLPAPSAAFLLQQRFFIMPKHKLLPFSVEGGAEPAEINDAWPTDVDPSEVVGTGPFQLAEYVAGQVVRLAKNEAYWKVDAAGTPLPYLDALTYLIVPGTDAQIAQFLAGNLDQLNISGAQFPDFKSRELAGADFTVVQSPALFGSPPHLAFNFDATDPDLQRAFSDVAFRQAMEYAVDRMRVIDDVYNGLAEIPGTPTAPANGAFFEDTTGLMRMYDLEAAAAALDALGYVDGDGDGVRNLTAERELEFTLTYGNDSATWTDIATILQNDFAEIGVRANLQGVQSSQLLGTGLSGDYEALLVALGNQPDPELRKPIWQPGGSLYYWHRSTQPAEQGAAPNFDAMEPWEQDLYEIFDLNSTESDPAVRAERYRAWQRINAEFVPVIMIAKPGNVAAVYDRVGNFAYSLGVIPGYNPVPFYFLR
ncbi:MAG: ABC transporter substrate-binding protein [Trueperaceae bacterium]